MGREIERKFLLSGEGWREGSRSTIYRQGYLSVDPDRTVRVRLAGSRGYLTVKGRAAGAERYEFEYEIPPEDAGEMLDELCPRPIIEKRRSTVDYRGLLWEIDEFFGENEGLVLAEVELERLDQEVDLPPWVGREVTGDERYFNAYLSRIPFRSWKRESADGTADND